MTRLALCLLLLVGSGSLAHDRQDKKGPDKKGPKAAPEKGHKLRLVLDAGGHTDTIDALAFTPDGRWLVSGSEDHTIRVWDAATGQPRQVIRPPGIGNSGRMALSPDGKSVAVASAYFAGGKGEPVVYLLSLADGKVEQAFRGHEKRVLAVAFSPKGDAVASSSHDGTIRVWNTATGKEAAKFAVDLDPKEGTAWHAGPGELAFAPKGERIAFIDAKGDCRLLSLKKEKAGRRLAAPADSRFVGVAWSPDGKTIATCGQGKTGGCQLWSPDGTAGLRLAGNPKEEGNIQVEHAAFGPNSDRVLVVWNRNTNHRATLFDAATGKAVVDYTPTKTQRDFGEPLAVRSGAVSPDGKLAATAGGDRGTNEIYLWKTDPVRNPKKDPPSPVRQLAARAWFQEGKDVGWTADGKGVAWYWPDQKKADRKGQMFDFATLRLKGFGPKVEVTGPALKEGPLTLERQDPGRLYSETQVVKGKKVIARIDLPPSSHVPLARTFVGPNRVAVGGDRGGFFLYDATTGKQVRDFKGIPDGVTTVAASPVGPRLLATAGTDQIVRVWHPDHEHAVLFLYVSGPDWVAWTPGGYYAATPGGERLVGWVADNGIDRAPTYHPAEHFRARLLRPDIVKKVLETGDVSAAVAAANADLKKAGAPVPAVVRNPEELLPPGVTITVDQSNLPKVKVTVNAKAVSDEQRVKSLRLLVNGRRLPLPDGKDVLEFDPGKEPREVKDKVWEVELPPGRHALAVLARSADDTPSFSNQVDVLAPLPPGARPGLHVLAVGVSEYDKVAPNLASADKDAKRIQGAFAAAVKAGEAYKAGASNLLQNQGATRKAVLAALDEARKGVKPGDLFVFSFAGHGTRDGGEFFLLTTDADPAKPKETAVSGTDLRAKLADFPCQVLVILDACHSGQIGGMPPGSDEAARALSAADVRVAVMCAALGHEEAKEKKDGGVFTTALAGALEKGKDADIFFDRTTGELNVYHLQAFVYQEVGRKTNYEQNPYLKMPLAHPAFTVNQFKVGPPGK